MVRVGGGWMSLDEFLIKNDPCRGSINLFSFTLITETLLVKYHIIFLLVEKFILIELAKIINNV